MRRRTLAASALAVRAPVWRLLARALTRAQKAPAARVLAGRAGAGRAAAGGESAAQSTQPALRRLPGTDIWHLSLPLPRGLRMAYQLVIDPVQWPAPGPHTRLQQVLAAGLGAQLDPLNPHAWHAGSADTAPPPGPDAAMPRLLACPFACLLSAAAFRRTEFQKQEQIQAARNGISRIFHGDIKLLKKERICGLDAGRSARLRAVPRPCFFIARPPARAACGQGFSIHCSRSF